MTTLNEFDYDFLPYPRYSPNLVYLNYFLFPNFKKSCVEVVTLLQPMKRFVVKDQCAIQKATTSWATIVSGKFHNNYN